MVLKGPSNATDLNAVTVLKLKKIWCSKDGSLYARDRKRFTANGYITYWETIDRTVKYADQLLFGPDRIRHSGTQAKPPLSDAGHQRAPPGRRHNFHGFKDKTDKFHWNRHYKH